MKGFGGKRSYSILRRYPCIRQVVLRQTTTYLKSRYPVFGPRSEIGTSEYESGVLTNQPRYSVSLNININVEISSSKGVSMKINVRATL
jgi:hypothetical protein